MLLPELINLDDYLRAHVDDYQFGKSKNDFGSRFEEAIAEALKEVGLEVLVRACLAEALEVDLIVRHENQVGVIQAKTGQAAQKKDGLDQLSAVCDQRYLGTYTAKMLAINCQWDDTQSNLWELARAWGITILELPSFTEPHPQLSAGDRRRLQSEVLRTLGG